jgi:hypothetical protein
MAGTLILLATKRDLTEDEKHSCFDVPHVQFVSVGPRFQRRSTQPP